MYQIIKLMALTILLIQCTTKNDNSIDLELEPWIEISEENLLENWGAPMASYKLNDGTNIISYSSSELTSRNYNYYYQPSVTNKEEGEKSCKISFFIDNTSRKVIRYTYKGDKASCLELITPNKKLRN